MTSFVFSTQPPKVSIPKIDIQPDGKISIIKAHFYSDQEFDEYIHELNEAFKGDYGPDNPDDQFSRIIPLDELHIAENLANAIVLYHGWDAISPSDGKLLIQINEEDYFIRVGSLGAN